MITSAIISVDVLARKLFSVSIGGANEIAGYALAISSAWAFSFTLLHRGHIRIDLIYNIVSPRWRASMDLVALAGMAVFIGVLAWYAYGVLVTSIKLSAHSSTPLGTPLWIPQSAWVAGLFFLLFVIAVLIGYAARSIASGNYSAARQLVGIPEMQEEVDIELQSAKSRLKPNRAKVE